MTEKLIVIFCKSEHSITCRNLSGPLLQKYLLHHNLNAGVLSDFFNVRICAACSLTTADEDPAMWRKFLHV